MEKNGCGLDEWKREDFGVLSFWAWNGEMDDESIRERIDEFHDQGFHGFFMHSRAGLLTPYMGEGWFHACRTAAACAQKYNMEAWIYDEDGWPSGFAGGLVSGISAEYQSKYIVTERNREQVDLSTLLASYKWETDGYELCDYDEGELWFYYKVEPNYVDLLSNKVTKKFIETTYDRYKNELGDYFGTVVPGFFTDEPQVNNHGFPYSLELEEYFQNKYNYSFIQSMYLFEMGEIEKAQEFRRDYWMCIEQMMRYHFSKQIYDWCESNHVKFTGHYPGEDSLIQQICSTGGVMPKYEYMQVPGIDHLGRRITPILLTKQVTSAAKQFARKKVVSETFGCAGWNITFEQQCYIWGWQASAGINVPCLHIGTHSMKGVRKRDYPAFYSYQEPWWDDFHYVTEWLSGINYKMSLGRWLEDVLVISPMGGVQLAHRLNMSDTEQMIGSQYRILLESLLDVQVGFDIGDEEILRKYGSIKENRIHVGACSYQIIIVPRTSTLEENTWMLLQEFEKNGGILVYTEEIPWLSNGKKKRVITSDNVPTVIQNRRGFWYKYFEASHYERKVMVLQEDGFAIATGLSTAIKEDDQILRTYIWNRLTDAVRNLVVCIKGKKAVYGVDLNTYDRIQLETSMDSEFTYVKIQLHKYQSLLLEAQDGQVYKKERSKHKIESIEGEIEICNENSLTIDYASYSFDGKEYTTKMQVVHMQDDMFKNLPKDGDMDIYIRYEFTNQMTKQQKLTVAIEDTHCVDVKCNDTSVFDNKEGWFIDRGILLYDITKEAKVGVNEIIVTYHMPKCQVAQVNGLYETEVNRFFYPVEPEAIYVQGMFDVDIIGEVCLKPTHIRTNVDNFVIIDQKAKTDMSQLTRDGLWFYRGNVAYHIIVEKCLNEKKWIKVCNPKGAYVEVRCNNKSKVCFMSPYDIDITDMLMDGINDVSVILHGTNRNILGPHHHMKGENNYVGLNVFKGEKGYEDIIVNPDVTFLNTWTDDYCFVEFGWDGLEVESINEVK